MTSFYYKHENPKQHFISVISYWCFVFGGCVLKADKYDKFTQFYKILIV